ncbi:MAG TPA: hypothetical protein PKD85_06905 [Saprospiraceae bacterium]|nr:hypothetical protein [Saprospiraceae bacterium]
MSDRGRYNRDKSSKECKKGDSKREEKERERDRSFAPPIPNLCHAKWRINHRRAGCARNCVTDRSHFNLWRNVYGRDLVNFHNIITVKTKADIPFEEFVYFAYSQSSGYVSPFIKSN